MIVALYIDPRGPYPGIPGVDVWPRERDATLYDGPHPVVAHPACGPWGRLEHMYTGKEGGPELAIRAVDQVRKCGGVLEHPAHSRLWAECGLPLPGEPDDEHGGFTLLVNQCDFGHVARKPTWLYCVRVPRWAVINPKPRKPTHWVAGRHSPYTPKTLKACKKKPGTCPRDIKICSSKQRIITPLEFACYLVSLARASRHNA